MRKKIIILIAVSLSLVLLVFISVFSENTKEFQFKKQPEIQQVRPKKPVKIKLKRSGDGKYTWELTGDDVDEIVNTDRRLRKQLRIE